MKDISELNPHKFETNVFVDANLKTLFTRAMELQGMYGGDFVVTSGLRDSQQQLALIKEGRSNALHSKHLSGNAVDIYDPDSKFHDWCKANEKALINVGFWCEERQGDWQHLQILPPGSGKRWFYP